MGFLKSDVLRYVFKPISGQAKVQVKFNKGEAASSNCVYAHRDALYLRALKNIVIAIVIVIVIVIAIVIIIISILIIIIIMFVIQNGGEHGEDSDNSSK